MPHTDAENVAYAPYAHTNSRGLRYDPPGCSLHTITWETNITFVFHDLSIGFREGGCVLEKKGLHADTYDFRMH